MFSPYQFNPTNFNPLRQVLEESVDFDELEKCQTTKLFLSTTNVRTGKVRVFRTEEITSDVVMASACLPMLFQAVKIGNDHYWDGGYMGNPALFPLFYHTQSRDLLVVHINPIEREELPTTAADIMNRLNEITFNSSLLKEMRAIAFVTKLIEEDWLQEKYKCKLKHLIMHSIRAEGVLSDLSVASKFNTDWYFLLYLRDLGRDEAGKWLKQNFASIGKRSTIDVRSEFLDLGTHYAG
jgi:NTE family protein